MDKINPSADPTRSRKYAHNLSSLSYSTEQRLQVFLPQHYDVRVKLNCVMFSAWSCELRWKTTRCVGVTGPWPLTFKWILEPDVMKFPGDVLEILRPQKCEVTHHHGLELWLLPPFKLLWAHLWVQARWSQDIAFKRPQGCFVVMSNFDLWPPKSKLFISESKWMLVEKSEDVPSRHSWNIMFTRVRQTSENQECLQRWIKRQFANLQGWCASKQFSRSQGLNERGINLINKL